VSLPLAATGTDAAEATAPRGVLAALCVTVTISYGTLYYAFAVLGPAISRDEGWSLTALTAGFSAASLIAGLVGVAAGREIQRRGPRRVMVLGAPLGAAGLLGLAMAPTMAWFIAAMQLCGVAGAGLFYAPAFPALTQWYGERRVEALTALTLVAGFASTIFAPLTMQLGDLVGWRWTYALLATLLLTTALPLHAVVLNRPWHHGDTPRHAIADREVVRTRRFRLVAAAGTLVTASEYASLVTLVPLLESRGMTSQAAAWVLGIGGAGQVLGRLFYPRLARSLGVRSRATSVAVLVAVPIGLLALVPGPPVLLLALSVAAGLGRGLFTLVAATLVSDVWGPERYAALNGVLSAPLAAAGALGPVAGAALASVLGGYAPMFGTLGVAAILGAALMAAALRGSASPRRTDRRLGRRAKSCSGGTLAS
jgi:MFS family permease